MRRVGLFPYPTLPIRVALYLAMITACTGSLALLALGQGSSAPAITVDVLAAVFLLFSIPCLVRDIPLVRSNGIRALSERRVGDKLLGSYHDRSFALAVPGSIADALLAAIMAVSAVLAGSAWTGCVAGYYIMLSAVRAWILFMNGRSKSPQEQDQVLRREKMVYRVVSAIIAMMGLALGGMTTLLANSSGNAEYPGLLVYAVAAYTFYRIGMSVRNLFRVKKERSLVLTSLRRIDWVSACVSLLLLQTALLATFGNGSYVETLLNIVVSGLFSTMAFLMGITGFIKGGVAKQQDCRS